MLATIALLLLAWQEPPVSGHEVGVVDDDHDQTLAEARAALERAMSAQEAGDPATARREAEYVVELLAPLPLGEGQDETAGLLWLVGDTAYSMRDFAVAREALGRVMEHHEQEFPENEPRRFDARSRLARVFRQTGDLAGARAHQEIVVAARERTLPEDHPKLLFSRADLAFTMQAMGDYADARALLEVVVATRERTLPEDHRLLLQARGSLAEVMRGMGDLAGARALLETVVEARERTLPQDHPDLAYSRDHLASTMRAMGDLAGALTVQQAVLADRERTLVEDHPNLLEARANLADTKRQMGDLAGACALQETVLAALERTQAADHPDLIQARHELAVTLSAMGDLAGALTLQQAVLADRERTLVEDHPNLLWARASLAETKRQMGDLAGARTLQETVLAAFERTQAADHPDLIQARHDLAVTLSAMGDLAGALTLQQAVLADRERTLVEDHPNLLWARANLADTLGKLGDLAAARALQEAVLRARERALPEDHPDLLAARHSLALTVGDLGDHPGARALQEAVLGARERTLPVDHPDVRWARANLANTMLAMGDLAEGRTLQESVLASCERTLPQGHPDLIATRYNLAISMSRVGDHAGARALKEAAVADFERVLPADHPHLLKARSSLAFTLCEAGELVEARTLLNDVLAACVRTLPADHPDLLRVRGNLAVTMHELGDLTAARVRGLELARGVILRLERASVLSPREARELASAETQRHSIVRSSTRPRSGEPPEPVRFDLAETLRATGVLAHRAVDDEESRRRLVSVLGRLNDLVSSGPDEGRSSEELAAEISRLTFERDRLEREIRSELAVQGVVTHAIRTADVARALRAGSAAIGFLRHSQPSFDSREASADDVLVAHLLFPDTSLAEFELGSADELERLVREWRATLGKPIERGLAYEGSDVDRERESGEALRRFVLAPILEGLPKETTTLHVCLDDILHLVPLGALPLGEDRVGDRYRILNEVSFARLLRTRPSLEGEPALLAMGGVKFDAETEGVGSLSAAARRGGRSARPDTFPPLLQTRFEAESVWALFEEEFGDGAVLLTKDEATKAAFHDLAPGRRFIHVATHGWFAPETVKSMLDPDPDRLWSPSGAQEAVTGLAPLTLCGLAFAGANHGRDSLGRVPGIMTAEELAGIDLSACDLAVLSACETNVGIRRAGQGIQSLQTALHAAGARTAITSLWKVDDAATRKLMERFYTYLWVEEMGKADALWKAKCDLRAEGHPVRDWAAWVLSGDPR